MIRQFVERHAEKTVEDALKFKYQEMEKLKTEIEELEEQKTDEDLREKKLPDNREVLDEDYSSDYFDKFLEDGEKEQDIEEATVTDVE